MPSSAAAAVHKTCPRCGSHFEADAVFCPKDGARLDLERDEPEADPYIGSVVLGDIEILSVAGTGAMGRVYRAHQRGIDRDVAVKILHRELSGNKQLVARFHREAKIASKLQHPHVVEVYLAGQLPDGALYIVMEYLDGLSLSAALGASGGKLTVERTMSIALQVCDAVGEGHARGIVHRDLKPENVMLVRRADVPDWAKVLDFGIARVNIGEQSMETAAGLIFGTARYISPEGAQGATVGPPADVYALATMVYQMLAGRTPFDAEPLGLLVKHIHETPPPLKSLPGTEDVPEPLARAVMDNLAKDPSRRAPTGRAFGNLLASAAKEANVSFSDVGIVARMSQLPDPAMAGSERWAAARALDPTLDDAANVTAPLVGGPKAVPAAPVPADAAPPPLPAPTPLPAPAEELRTSRSSVEVPRSTAPWVVIIVLAFLLGTTLAILGMQRMQAQKEDERRAYVARTRHLLARGHYVSPPGENVKELVESGLRRWKDDDELVQLRSAAEHEMVTMAMAARESGDVVGARNLARDAAALDPTDNSARFTLAQAEDDLRAIEAGPGVTAGPPRLVFESPPVAKAGSEVVMTCRIVPGAAGPKARIGNIRMSILPNGKPSGGAPVALSQTDATSVRAVLTAPATPGSYDVAFTAEVDGNAIRAMRDLDVIP